MYKEKLSLGVDNVIKNGFKRYKHCEYIKQRQKQAKFICLYGAGEFLNDYVKNIEKFDCICDSNPEKWGKTFAGKICISPEELFAIEDVVVFIMAGKYKSISEFLNKNNIENYYFGDLFLNVYDECYSSKWFEDNKQKIIDTVDLFEDEWSKKVYTNAILNRIAPEYADMSFHDMEQRGEYFSTGIFNLSNNECFVDCGAFDGDSIKAFQKETEGKFDAIYGFELDNINYDKMLSDNDISSDNRIKLFNEGVSDKEYELSVLSNGEGSHISEDGINKVKLYSLDEKLKDQKITFIKMDVEGSEQKAIKGAENIIKSQHPKLAISVYHKLDDLWNIPLQIKEFDDRYKLKLRHHTAIAWDTNLYAAFENRGGSL